MGGLLVNYVGSLVALLSIALVHLIGTRSVDATASWLESGGGLWVDMFLTVLFSFLGGYTAASIANRKPVLHSLLSVAVATSVSLPSFFRDAEYADPRNWLLIASIVLVAVAAGRLVASR